MLRAWVVEGKLSVCSRPSKGQRRFVGGIKHKGHLFCVSVEQLKTIVSGVFCFDFVFLIRVQPWGEDL